MYAPAAQRQVVARQAIVERILLTVVVLALLAVCLTLVAAPWAPERAEAAAELFFGAAPPARAEEAREVAFQRETGSGAHLAGSPVSITPDRAAAAD